MTEESYFEKVRKNMRLTQAEMAGRMGMSRGTVVNLESGNITVVPDSVLNFCKVSGISLLEVIEALYPEFCDNLLKEEAHYKEMLRQTVDEYEARLDEKNREINNQKELNRALQQTVDVQKQMLGMYERQSAKKD